MADEKSAMRRAGPGAAHFVCKGFSSMQMNLLAWFAAAAVCLSVTAQAASQPPSAIPSAKAHRSLLLDVARAGARVVAVGERGHIVLSDDAGKSWRQAVVPVRSLLTAVYFVDDQRGWVVGHDSVVLATADGGSTWALQHYQEFDPDGGNVSGNSSVDETDMDADVADEGVDPVRAVDRTGVPLLDVWFSNEREGFAVGAFGLLLRTQDGGVHWEDRSSTVPNPEGWHFNAITADAAGTVLIAGEKGTLYRSSDRGNAFVPADSPYQGSFFGLIGAADGSVYLLGLQGSLYRAARADGSWLAAKTGISSGLNDGCALPGSGIMLVGNAGAVLAGSNGELRLERREDRQSVLSCVAVGDGVVLVGEGGAKRADYAGRSR